MARLTLRRFGAVFAVMACVACTTSPPPQTPQLVTSGEVVVPLEQLEKPSWWYTQLANLPANDALRGDNAGQILSIFGREEIVAATAWQYRDRECEIEPLNEPFMDYVIARARETSIVMIGESHTRTWTRAAIMDLAVALREEGYTHFAAEGFRTGPLESIPFLNEDRDYPIDGDGAYMAEASYGRLFRKLKALDYQLVPYEDYSPGPEIEDNLDRINARDAAQTENLMANVLRNAPDTKILIHVGYGHHRETSFEWSDGRVGYWLGYRLKEATGVDPFTIEITTCQTATAQELAGQRARDSAPYRFDVYLNKPRPAFVRGRPTWRVERGDVLVDIPEALLPTDDWHVIEARAMDEPDEAVPMDRVLVRPGEDVALALPPGAYRVRAVALGREMDDRGQ